MHNRLAQTVFLVFGWGQDTRVGKEGTGGIPLSRVRPLPYPFCAGHGKGATTNLI